MDQSLSHNVVSRIICRLYWLDNQKQRMGTIKKWQERIGAVSLEIPPGQSRRYINLPHKVYGSLGMTAKLGAAKLEGKEGVGRQGCPVLFFGSTKVNNNFDIVDAVGKEDDQGMTATLLRRAATNTSAFPRAETRRQANVRKWRHKADMSNVCSDVSFRGQSGPVRFWPAVRQPDDSCLEGRLL